MFRIIILIAIMHAELISQVASANILVLMPLRLKSHKIILDQVTAELIERGHNITYVSSYPAEENLPGMNNIYLKDTAKGNRVMEFPHFRKRNLNVIGMMSTSLKLTTAWCNLTMSDSTFKEFLQTEQKFDAVLLSAYYNDYLLSVGHHFQAPTVLLYSGNTMPYTQWMLDVPTPMSTFVQTYLIPYAMTPPLNFRDRFYNAVGCISNFFYMKYLLLPNLLKVVQEVLPNTPPIPEMFNNVAFTLINAHPLMTGIQPSMPNVAHIGGIQLRPAKPLNDEWSNIVNATGEDGFILFSLGSVSTGISISETLRMKLLKVFRLLPQTVFAKFEQNMSSVPSNVKLYKWFPLQDLMAHPKCKLLINHGGLLSMQEAMYHGVPVVSLPPFPEHLANSARAASQGFGRFLMWKTFTVEEGYKTITEVASNPMYRENAQRMSKLVKDYPIHPKKLAAYWVEHVIRFKGAHHLKNDHGNLNILQYFSIDVFGFMMIIVTLLFTLFIVLPIYLLYKLVRFLQQSSHKSAKANNVCHASNGYKKMEKSL